jgi:putative hydrolase
VEPTQALRRIAYLLERDGAETYKVRAFRHAALAVEQVPADELATLSSSRLRQIPGIGETSAQVIVEAMAGKTPGYLEKLEAVPPASISDAAANLRRLLQGDCHGHSEWSDGGSPIREMALAARDLGHSYWALTDHSPRLTVAHGLDADRLREQLEVVATLNDELAPFRILTGIEVDILDDGSLDQDDELLAQLDVVVASVHSKLRMDAAAMTKRMVRAVMNPHADILGHCTGRIIVGRGRPQSEFDAATVFEALATTGTALEINCRPERLDPPDELLALALSLGCVMTIDTDAHAPGQLEWQGNGCEVATALGVPVERIMNAGSVDDLLAWTASHES